jgi:DNA-binding transcriptional ArsR family regulator
VTALLASAVTAIARRRFGWHLSALEAAALAEIGDIDSILSRVIEHRGVARTAGGRLLSRSGQQSVAIAQAVADHRAVHLGSPDERIDYLRQLVEKERQADRETADASESARRVERFVAQSEVSSRQVRELIRRVGDLRLRQRNRLTAALADPLTRRAALEHLDEVYASFLGRFVALSSDESRST